MFMSAPELTSMRPPSKSPPFTSTKARRLTLLPASITSSPPLPSAPELACIRASTSTFPAAMMLKVPPSEAVVLPFRFTCSLIVTSPAAARSRTAGVVAFPTTRPPMTIFPLPRVHAPAPCDWHSLSTRHNNALASEQLRLALTVTCPPKPLSPRALSATAPGVSRRNSPQATLAIPAENSRDPPGETSNVRVPRSSTAPAATTTLVLMTQGSAVGAQSSAALDTGSCAAACRANKHSNTAPRINWYL